MTPSQRDGPAWRCRRDLRSSVILVLPDRPGVPGVSAGMAGAGDGTGGRGWAGQAGRKERTSASGSTPAPRVETLQGVCVCARAWLHERRVCWSETAHAAGAGALAREQMRARVCAGVPGGESARERGGGGGQVPDRART